MSTTVNYRTRLAGLDRYNLLGLYYWITGPGPEPNLSREQLIDAILALVDDPSGRRIDLVDVDRHSLLEFLDGEIRIAEHHQAKYRQRQQFRQQKQQRLRQEAVGREERIAAGTPNQSDLECLLWRVQQDQLERAVVAVHEEDENSQEDEEFLREHPGDDPRCSDLVAGFLLERLFPHSKKDRESYSDRYRRLLLDWLLERRTRRQILDLTGWPKTGKQEADERHARWAAMAADPEYQEQLRQQHIRTHAEHGEEILDFHRQGLTPKQIARKLGHGIGCYFPRGVTLFLESVGATPHLDKTV
jgi:hypothetical protein